MKNKFKKQMFVQSKKFENDNQRSLQPSTSFIDPAKYMTNGEFHFKVPPEAPVFEPTIEEFLDPLAYIHKIKPIAEKTGICKVKPPAEWHPPFAVDVDRFKFTPRVQKLNELDASTRVKLYFLDRLATYWNYNGVQIRIPAIDDKSIDMYSLYKIVELEGGFDKISFEKKWTKVAMRMGYVNAKTVAPALKLHYKRLLLPYEKFEQMKMKQCEETDEKFEPNKSDDESFNISSSSGGSSSSKLKVITTDGSSGGTKRCTRSNCDENYAEILVSETFKNPILQDKNKELQRLTFYGPGPKILGGLNKRKQQDDKESNEILEEEAKYVPPADVVAAASYNCLCCGSGDTEELILLCDSCDDGYHTFCLVPPLSSVPKGEWRCPKCIAVVVNKPNDSFGFEQAEREYTLQQFGEMADQFKSNYFNMPVHLVPTEKVECEYWRILSSLDSNVTVEYGADLHSMDHGSGFPTYLALNESGDDNSYYKSYVESSWNLNNIPVLEGSVLGYINADISGMKIPWMYVGMCFSTFCWHNEDHWSYSINYLHWGEPKTWYGVPGSKAEEFEKVMQDTTPDLFYHQPDLLHQLVTILNPNILMDKGVPVYHIDQAAGEFVLTFPRAYHAGFNHGYNFAEAVNFAPVDWIPLGRLCIDHYSSLHRYCVFSHDELICKMASLPDNLNSKLAAAAHKDMIKMLEYENKQRKLLLEWGVINAEREAFELLADDERQCLECNTTCFLSAVTCKCSPKKLTCLRHFKNLCECAPLDHTLRYRYTLDELPVMLDKLKEKADSVSVWAAKVHDALDITTPRTVTLSDLKDLLNEAYEKHFPDDPSLNHLSKAIKAVQDALAVDFQNILAHKQSLTKKVTIKEIKCYYEELQRIPCILPQENTVKHFFNFLNQFEKDVNCMMNDDKASVNDVEELMKRGNFPNIDIPQIEKLKNYLEMLRWIEKYNEIKTQGDVRLDNINNLMASGKNLLHFFNVKECYSILVEDKNRIEEWEHACEEYVNVKSSSRTKPSLSQLEELLKETNQINYVLPSKQIIFDIVQRGIAWKKHVQDLLLGLHKYGPFIQYVENIVEDGCNQIIHFEELDKLQVLINEVYAWKERIGKIFLKNDSPVSLLEVLTPRKSTMLYSSKYKNENINEANNIIVFSEVDLRLKTGISSEEIFLNLKMAEKREMELMWSLRIKNIYKRINCDGRFCICQSAISDDMEECSLCKDLFHQTCLLQEADNSIHLDNYYKWGKFLCSRCQRSKRPTTYTILEEVRKLKEFKIHTIEGVALKRLAERALKWKNSVDTIFLSSEISSAVNFLNSVSDSDKKLHFDGILTDEQKSILESFSLEGDLIEVNLPENNIIWRILKNSKQKLGQYEPKNSLGENIEVQHITITSSAKEDVQAQLKYETFLFKKKILNSVIFSQNNKKHFTMLQKNDDNEIKIIYDNSNVGNKVRLLDNKNLSKIRDIQRRRNKLRTTVLENQRIYAEQSGDSGSSSSDSITEDENGGVCDMTNCIKPNGDHVDWVQCDYCKSWLHMVCAGVKKNQVEQQTEFKCRLCVNSNKRDHSQKSNSASVEKTDEIIVIDCAADYSS